MKTFLTAQWRHLVFINYEVDPAILKPYIPADTELDFFNGKCYVSLVAFKFVDTKVHGLPIPFNRNFEELNLRFYVRRKVGNTWRHGVVFAKEIVGKRLVLLVANLFYGEHFCYHSMESEVVTNDSSTSIKYRFFVKKNWDSLHVTCNKSGVCAAPDTLEHFIVEHYWGYTQLANGKTGEYRIKRSAWFVHKIRECNVNINTLALYGERLHQCFCKQPVSVFVVDGSPVTMYKRKILLG